MKFKTIQIDSPWPERGGGQIKRGADDKYALLKVKDILTLGEAIGRSYADDDAHLYSWGTNNYAKENFQLVEAMGFRYITAITWCKTGGAPGLGQYHQGETEHCLFAVRGKTPYKVVDGIKQRGRTAIKTPDYSDDFDLWLEYFRMHWPTHRWFDAPRPKDADNPRGIHSRKPPEIYRMIEKVSYGPMLEVFARIALDGWYRMGAEAPSGAGLLRFDHPLFINPSEPELEELIV